LGRFPFLSHEFFYQGKGKHPSKKPTTLHGGKSYEGTPAQHVYYRGFCGSGTLRDDIFDHL